MKTIISLVLFLACAVVRADELRVSSVEPVFVVAPGQWQSAKFKGPTASFPFDTYQITAPSGRNAECLVSIYDKNKTKLADPEMLKKLVRGDSRPYVSSPEELPKIEIKELKIKGGLGFYANFIDPDLVGKPVEKGNYKTVTPVIVSLGTNYLMKVTVLCDEIGGVDYQDAIKIVQSIKIKNQ